MIPFESITKLSSQIAEAYAPERIVLFGSYADGTASELSDVDLLVVMNFEGRAFRKSLEMLRRFDPPFDVDIIARRPEDTARRFREGDPLIRAAFISGRVLYERDHLRVDRQS